MDDGLFVGSHQADPRSSLTGTSALLGTVRHDGFFQAEPIPEKRILSGKSNAEWNFICWVHDLRDKSLVRPNWQSPTYGEGTKLIPQRLRYHVHMFS